MATLLIGYDVESAAVGESLARITDPEHRLEEGLEADSTVAGLDVLRAVHREFGVPCTLFCCGRTVLHSVDAIRAAAADPLVDIQQHTYSHALFKEDVQRGATFPASPAIALNHEVRTTSQILAEHIDVTCIGLRTPHGYSGGLTDRLDLVEMLAAAGIRYVSSWARDEEGNSPTPMQVQPFWYETESGAEVLEIPFQFWLDVAWFEEAGLSQGEQFGELLKGAIDEIVREDLVYATCFHDWALLRYDAAGSGWIGTLLAYALEQGVEVMSYTDYYERAAQDRMATHHGRRA